MRNLSYSKEMEPRYKRLGNAVCHEYRQQKAKNGNILRAWVRKEKNETGILSGSHTTDLLDRQEIRMTGLKMAA